MTGTRDARGRFAKKRAASAVAAPTEGAEAEEGAPSESFLMELRASWARYGSATIEKVRNDRPHDYLRLMASSLAKSVEADDDPIGAMTDDEIADELRSLLGRLAATGADPGA